MRRVVITGIGTINPLAHNVSDTWQAVREGRSGIAPITAFDTSEFPVKAAGEIKHFEPSSFIDPKAVRRLDRYQWLASIAAREALASSGYEVTEANSLRTGVAVCSAVGGMETMVDQIVLNHEEGSKRLNPFTIPKIMSNGASGTISIEHGIRGLSFSVASACASSSDGIGLSIQLIRSGIVDAMLSGGAEASITSFAIGCFDRVSAASRSTDGTPRPFSKDRDGLIMGESATVLVLEELGHAQARGAEILAEIVGYGATADAHHITAPIEDGSGGAAAIAMALNDGGINPSDVDYVNAHGTGTSLNDAAETAAIKRALGDHAYRVPVSSTKSMHGHCMGSTAALEALICVMAIRDNIVPPTINLTSPDPACDLDYVPNEARDNRTDIAISNSFGFGGHNSVLVFRRFNDR
ncbi:MAG: beta-ketoacyl-ACP synthase II [Anaerolineae bacterium]|nr:beta-ketoacyl-ACP synthase II [Anaerolineae bacterium]